MLYERARRVNAAVAGLIEAKAEVAVGVVEEVTLRVDESDLFEGLAKVEAVIDEHPVPVGEADEVGEPQRV